MKIFIETYPDTITQNDLHELELALLRIFGNQSVLITLKFEDSKE